MTRPKNVLIIRNAWGFGGAEMYTLNLAKALRSNGYSPTVITRVPELIEKCSKESINHIKGPWYKKQGWGRVYIVLNPVITIWYFFIILFKNIDIIHAQGKDDFIFATQAARLLRKKVVWTDHADLKYIMEPHNKPSLRRKIIKLANYAKVVIAVSHSEEQEIKKRYSHFPNLEVVYNGVFLPKEIKTIKKPKLTIIGSTNRLVKSKGIAELIEGFAKIDNLDKSELWLVGDGEDKQEFIDLVKRVGIYERVKFYGYQEVIWPYLRTFDIYVQPSYHEAFSLSLIEASVLGKKVIATRTGGNPEIINSHTGTLVSIKNSNQITQAINSCLNNPRQSSAKSKKLGEIARKEFDFDKIVKEKIIPFYEK